MLKKEGKKALYVSKLALDCKKYHHQDTSISWEKCYLRKWLNSEFLRNAFSGE